MSLSFIFSYKNEYRPPQTIDLEQVDMQLLQDSDIQDTQDTQDSSSSNNIIQ